MTSDCIPKKSVIEIVSAPETIAAQEKSRLFGDEQKTISLGEYVGFFALSPLSQKLSRFALGEIRALQLHPGAVGELYSLSQFAPSS